MDITALTRIPDVIDLIALAENPDPVERAVAADEVMWLGPRGSYAPARDIRRLALTEALEVGIARERIAARLGVRLEDVERLASS